MSEIVTLCVRVYSFPFSLLLHLTGDNMLTAISVARDCGMIRAHERVIIADAVPPKDVQSASITWRYTENPSQVVKDNQVRQISKEKISGLRAQALVCCYVLSNSINLSKLKQRNNTDSSRHAQCERLLVVQIP